MSPKATNVIAEVGTKLQKTKTLYSNQRVWKIAKNFDLQEDTKLAHEVQKYECI